MKKRRLLVLIGAGISAESGIQTFRDSGGFWDQNAEDEIANINSWNKIENREKILKFHKDLYLLVKGSKPNQGHLDLVKLEEIFEKVVIVTQNVDDLHEKADSKNIIHLHGEINKISNELKTSIKEVESDDYIKIGELDEEGKQMSTFVIWFGENLGFGIDLNELNNTILNFDVLLVVGTSLNVFPAANILSHFHKKEIYVIDPNELLITNKTTRFIKDKASTGVQQFIDRFVN